jgi:hypothetical protein
MLGTGAQKLSRKDLERKCSYLREEIDEVKQEFEIFISRINNNDNQPAVAGQRTDAKL